MSIERIHQNIVVRLIVFAGKYKLKRAVMVPVNSAYKINFLEKFFTASWGNKFEVLFAV
jgi:hypothetical protein